MSSEVIIMKKGKVTLERDEQDSSFGIEENKRKWA